MVSKREIKRSQRGLKENQDTLFKRQLSFVSKYRINMTEGLSPSQDMVSWENIAHLVATRDVWLLNHAGRDLTENQAMFFSFIRSL